MTLHLVVATCFNALLFCSQVPTGLESNNRKFLLRKSECWKYSSWRVHSQADSQPNPVGVLLNGCRGSLVTKTFCNFRSERESFPQLGILSHAGGCSFVWKQGSAVHSLCQHIKWNFAPFRSLVLTFTAHKDLHWKIKCELNWFEEIQQLRGWKLIHLKFLRET